MKRSTIVGGALGVGILALLLVPSGRRAVGKSVQAVPGTTAGTPPAATPAVEGTDEGFLFGRVTTTDGATYQGRLRFGQDQEAFWGDAFNGVKFLNAWMGKVPAGKLPKQESESFKILGVELGKRERQSDLGRRFLARFGDISRVESMGTTVRVTLKSGTVFDLRRLDASDFDDGLRVWDEKKGVVDLDSLRIRTIEFLPSVRRGTAPVRLYGTVHTEQGDFTGFVQWDRDESVGSDTLDGNDGDGEHSLRFDTIRSIARRDRQSSRVTLLDGREMELFATNDVNAENRGIGVDDPRYGRVVVSWDAFERVDFGPGGVGPGYGDFPPGRPLTGGVTTRDGRRQAGRLVFDLDESETTETLDGSSPGVDYTIPFGLIASIVPPAGEEGSARMARVTLHGGEVLELERSGDLGDSNAGLLVFPEGQKQAEYVPWGDVTKIELDRPPAMFPPVR